MKAIIFKILILAAIINIACQKKAEISANNQNETVRPAEQIAPPPKQYEEILLNQRFSNFNRKNPVTSLKYLDYRIKRTSVKKDEGPDSITVDIYDAVLTKKGKRIARFEGVYTPSLNEMSFGLFPFLGGRLKQLFVFDESLHTEHDWIVSFDPDFKVIYHNDDFNIYNGFGIFDVDNDGIYELSAGKSADMTFPFGRGGELALKIVLKYDPVSRKYLPATHIFPEIVLNGFEEEGFDEQVRAFKTRNEKGFREFLQIFQKYIYAGREADAWKFFDENVSALKMDFGMNDQNENPKEKMISALRADPIYQYIKADLKKKNDK